MRDTADFLRIEGGMIGVGSLATPGYGVAFEPDLAAMIPLDRWSPACLEESA
jgi:hypothetical protein